MRWLLLLALAGCSEEPVSGLDRDLTLTQKSTFITKMRIDSGSVDCTEPTGIYAYIECTGRLVEGNPIAFDCNITKCGIRSIYVLRPAGG
jgi:hypothetical protein